LGGIWPINRVVTNLENMERNLQVVGERSGNLKVIRGESQGKYVLACGVLLQVVSAIDRK